jgi:hypothetical protein
MDDDLKEKILETREAVDVLIQELATLRLGMFEQSVAIEKLLALQKDLHTEAGKIPRTKKAIEDQLLKIDLECRRRVADRLKSGHKSAGETPLGDHPSPPDQN